MLIYPFKSHKKQLYLWRTAKLLRSFSIVKVMSISQMMLRDLNQCFSTFVLCYTSSLGTSIWSTSRRNWQWHYFRVGRPNSMWQTQGLRVDKRVLSGREKHALVLGPPFQASYFGLFTAFLVLLPRYPGVPLIPSDITSHATAVSVKLSVWNSLLLWVI